MICLLSLLAPCGAPHSGPIRPNLQSYHLEELHGSSQRRLRSMAITRVLHLYYRLWRLGRSSRHLFFSMTILHVLLLCHHLQRLGRSSRHRLLIITILHILHLCILAMLLCPEMLLITVLPSTILSSPLLIGHWHHYIPTTLLCHRIYLIQLET